MLLAAEIVLHSIAPHKMFFAIQWMYDGIMPESVKLCLWGDCCTLIFENAFSLFFTRNSRHSVLQKQKAKYTDSGDKYLPKIIHHCKGSA